MIRLQERVQVRRPTADCYRYMLDMAASEQWNPAVENARKSTPGPVGRQSRFEVDYRFAGRQRAFGYELVDTDPGRSLSLRGQGPDASAREHIEFRPGADETFTEILYTLDLDVGGLAERLQAIIKPWLTAMGHRAMEDLRRALEPSRVEEPGVWQWLRYRALLPAALEFSRLGYQSMPDRGLSDFIDGRIVVVTGATGGLGLAAAKELSRLGATLILVGRDRERLRQAQNAVRAFSGCGVDALHTVEADLSRLEEVRLSDTRIHALTPQVHGLINNAGALFNERDLTTEGTERTLAVNLLAPYLLTEKLLPALERGQGRVVNVASGGLYLQALHLDDMEFENERFDGAKAYARAKRALVAQTEHWAEQHPGVRFNSMHPGWADTPGVAASLPVFHKRVGPWLRSPRQGADTMVWLVSSPAVANISGRFWFDRRPRPTAVLPGTRVTPEQRRQLARWLAARCRPGHGGPI